MVGISAVEPLGQRLSAGKRAKGVAPSGLFPVTERFEPNNVVAPATRTSAAATATHPETRRSRTEVGRRMPSPYLGPTAATRVPSPTRRFLPWTGMARQWSPIFCASMLRIQFGFQSGRQQVVLVHDDRTQCGGAERAVLAMERLFRGAPLFTSLYDPEATFPEFQDVDVRTTWLNRIRVSDSTTGRLCRCWQKPSRIFGLTRPSRSAARAGGPMGSR